MPVELPELETFDVLDGKFQYTCSKEDNNLTEFVRKEHIWEPWTTRIIRERVKPGMSVYDVGAAWGYFTMLIADILGESRPVVAFEPNPVNREILRLNLRQNNIKNALVMPCALSDFSGVAPLHYAIQNLGACSLESHVREENFKNVSVYPLDDLCHEQVDFIKIDAEGTDYKVLLGAKKTIERSPRIQIITEYIPVFHNANREEPFDIMDSLGLRVYYVTPAGDFEEHSDRKFYTEGGGATLYLTHK